MVFVKEVGWEINFQKSELTPTQHFDFLSYRFSLSKGEVEYFGKGDTGFTNKFNNHSQNYYVIHRDTSLSRKDSPNGQSTHETVSVAPENSLEISPITGHSDSLFRDFDSQWHVVGHIDKTSCKYFGIEGSVSSNKGFSNSSSRQKGSSRFPQCNSSVLLQQIGGTHSLEDVSNGFLQSQSNFAEGSPHSGLSKCDSRQPVMQGQHHTNRMVSSSQNFQMICQIWHRPMVDMFATK